MEPDALLAALGARVRELRRSRGQTLRQLAAQSGLSARFLVNVEGGRGNISVRNLLPLAVALGTTPAALLHIQPEGDRPRIVALLGARGAGKTTVGRQLARRLAVPFVELDRRVEEAAGLELGEIFALHGEAYYRRLEREALERVLDEPGARVLATGGALVTAAAAWTALRARALTVWLRAEPEDLWRRVVARQLDGGAGRAPEALAELRRLLREREPLYARAQLVVDTSRLGIEGSVHAIETHLRGGAEARGAVAD